MSFARVASGARRVAGVTRLAGCKQGVAHGAGWRRTGPAAAVERERRAFHGTARRSDSKRDYYEVLGVGRDVDEKELKKKYRELAKKYHPDSCKDPDATTKFQEISHAYEILSDPEKRKAYDTFGPDFEQGGMGASGDAGGFSGFQGFDFGDMFGGFGGSRGPQTRKRKGEDVNIQINLSFMEAALGCSKTVSYPAMCSCKTCSGSGVKSGEKEKTTTCRTCRGSGTIAQNVGGLFAVSTECPACKGKGKRVTNPCSSCSGSGLETETLTETINIPAGVDSETMLSKSGSGSQGANGKSRGDLTISIRVAQDSYFKRSGPNILTTLKLSLAQAVLGDDVTARTVDGSVNLKVPMGTKHGEVRRLRGKGLPDLQSRGGVGDQYVTFEVDMPTKLTDRQKELIREFEKEEKKKDDKSASS